MMSDQEIKEMIENDDMETQRKKCLHYAEILSDYQTNDEKGHKRLTIFTLNDYTHFCIAMLNGNVIKTSLF